MGPLILAVDRRSGVAGVDNLFIKPANLLSFEKEPKVKVEEEGDPICMDPVLSIAVIEGGRTSLCDLARFAGIAFALSR
jgi:hypothetical protein